MVSASGLSTRARLCNTSGGSLRRSACSTARCADEFQQPRLQAEMCFPQLAVVHVFDPFPDLGVGAVLVPARSQMAVVETEHLRRQPGGDVHAVGDVADGHFLLGLAGIEPRPHGAGDLAMQGRNGIGAPRKLQAQHGHAELFEIVVRIHASQRHELFVRKTHRLAQRSKVFLDQVGAEPVVTGGHRRVRREHHFARNARHGLVEIQPFLLHAAANRLEHGEPAVPFVQVQRARE